MAIKKTIGQIVGVRTFISKGNKKCRVFYVVSNDDSEREDCIGKECVEILAVEPDECFASSAESFLGTYVEYVSVSGRTFIMSYDVEV